MRSSAERRATALAVVIALAPLAACRTTNLAWRVSEPPWTEEEHASLVEARAHADALRHEEAWSIVAPLAAAHPSDLALATWLQDLRFELLAAGSRVDPALEPWQGSPSARDAVRKLYAEQAREHESPVLLVLAARVEDDAIAAATLLDRALELAPELAWAHYGKAHALLRTRTLVERWELATRSLARALQLDPGLIGARRLEAWMLAHAGSVGDARAALETWLERAGSDVRVGAREHADAAVDLALLRVLDGDAEHARELLESLEGNPVGRARRLSILAVAAAELGDVETALQAARSAEDASLDVLSVVQQALLQQYWLEDDEAARELWSEVIERASDRPDLSTVLQAMRAQLMLERLEPDAAPAAGADT